MLTTEEKKTNEQKTKEFEKRVDMLALTLSLKGNDQFFEGNGGYQLLFSTYIKMIESDHDNFFIEKERKKKIIQSLERTKAFYQFKKQQQLQAVFETMSNDDSTDFMLFPSVIQVEKNEKELKHLVGLTVYKKKHHFIVMKVDKQGVYNYSNVSYYKIPLPSIAQLSQLFFSERNTKKTVQYSIFKSLAKLSNEVRTIPRIILKEQSIGNCIISEVEASLRLILFNCQTDLFRLGTHKVITPKWNLKHQEPTLEMRRRFLSAVKGEDKDWNQHFDYIFDYYLYRKGKLVEIPFSYIDIKGKWWYRKIHKIFSLDSYIPEMLRSGGQILPVNKEQQKEDDRTPIELVDELYKESIRKSELPRLQLATKKKSNAIKILSARLSSIKIEVAKEKAEILITCLKRKNKEIEAEIKRRKELEKGNQDGIISNRTLNQLVSKTVSERTKNFQKISTSSNEKVTIEKSELTELMEKVKKSQHEFRNFSQQNMRNIKKQSPQYEK
ncbi:hypothetical protein E1H99_00330 [Enterococcus hirae]|nr:hypothetical protein E1H99_00330 [Enterococcus hirae]